MLFDNRRLSAKVIGVDENTDLAVLKVNTDRLRAAQLGDSDRISVGDFVVAVGNPFALGQTVTLGIVSAIRYHGTDDDKLQDYIQTDASINPGNSGGALVSMDGDVVGINSMIFETSLGNSGIGFAIPINVAREIMRELIQQAKEETSRSNSREIPIKSRPPSIVINLTSRN